MTVPAFREYPKIYSPFVRHTTGPQKNRFIEGVWSRPEFECLQDAQWNFAEKVNGTNVRVHWDGHKVRYGGRTDDAQLPTRLIHALDELVPEELFEQAFGETAVTLFGEGYGAATGVNGSGKYRPEASLVLFDVSIGGWWLERPNVEDVASKLGLDPVPLILVGTLHQGIDRVRQGLTSRWGEFPAEGLVGVPTANLLSRSGERIAVKIKTRDLPAEAAG